MSIKTTSSAVTRGVRVDVQSEYMESHSQPAARQFSFAYTIRITNEGQDIVQLRSRHWKIRNAYGELQEVKGEGVVGEQPILRPGEAFEYTSGASLTTERGSMEGTYQMHLTDGTQFDAVIAAFALERPFSLN